jgi:hypothetical protein
VGSACRFNANVRPAPPLPGSLGSEETAACFIVRDHNGQALAYVYFEEEPGRRSAAGDMAAVRSAICSFE